MTTSTNIAGTITPFVMLRRGDQAWPYGKKKVFHIDEINPGKKPKKSELLYYGEIGMIKVESIKSELGEEKITVPVGRKEDGFWKHLKSGKIGVWRTVKGNRYFFPTDGSGPIPKMRGVKGGGKPGASGKSLYKSKEKKPSGIFDRIKGWISSKLGGGGGATASLKDVKPKGGGRGVEKAPTKMTPKKSESGGKKTEKKKSEKKKENIPGRKKTLEKVESMLIQARRSKRGGKVVGALRKMQAALKSDDADAFRKAEEALAKATKKLEKQS